MNLTLKSLVKETLKRWNVGITTYSNLQQLIESRSSLVEIRAGMELILELPDRHAAQLLKTLRSSRSQLRQDLVVLAELDFKRNGFFVEFGATNGVDLSNTYLLEKQFGWKGILAEPAKRWHPDLKRNRTACIELDCVWKETNSVLTFNEVEQGEFSTIDSYSSSDFHLKERTAGKTYSVKTISLEDLLAKHGAPQKIDYLSIDTEGSEFEILNNFNFDKYQFTIITCEHNFTSARGEICSLLTKKGLCSQV